MSWLRSQLEQSSCAALIKRFQSLTAKQKQWGLVAGTALLGGCLYGGVVMPMQEQLNTAQYQVDQAVETQQLLVNNWSSLQALGQQESAIGANTNVERHIKTMAAKHGITLDRMSTQGDALLVSTKETALTPATRFLEALTSASIPLGRYEITKSSEDDGKITMKLTIRG